MRKLLYKIEKRLIYERMRKPKNCSEIFHKDRLVVCEQGKKERIHFEKMGSMFMDGFGHIFDSVSFFLLSL